MGLSGKQMSKWKKAGLRLLIYGIVTPVLVILAFEGLYRAYGVDFYAPELSYFNTDEELSEAGESPAMLILGDSYTAGNYTYAFELKSMLAGTCRVINSGISGTGIVQTNLIAPSRLRQFKPETVVYQIYTGNDLFDLRYPVNWQEMGLKRNLYWSAANHLRGISFLNYRLGQQFRTATQAPQPNTKKESDSLEVFSLSRYSQREKLYLQAEPELVSGTLGLRGTRSDDFERLLKGLDILADQCEEAGAKLVIMPIPHPAEVSEKGLDEHLLLGGEVSASQNLLQPDLPFYTQLAKHFSNSEVRVFLPKEELIRLSRQHPLYFANDPHLNPRGQRLLATLLLEYLYAENCVPGS